MLDNTISPSCLSLESIDMHSAGLGKKYDNLSDPYNFKIGNFAYHIDSVAYEMDGYDGGYGYGACPYGQQIWFGDSRTTEVSVLHDNETTEKWEKVGSHTGEIPGCSCGGATYDPVRGRETWCKGDHEIDDYDWVTHSADPYTKMEDVTVKVLSKSAPIDWKTWIPNGKLNTLILYGNGIMFWYANTSTGDGFEPMYKLDANGNLTFNEYGKCTSDYVRHAYPEIRFGTLPAEMWENDDPVMMAHKKWKDKSTKSIGCLYLLEILENSNIYSITGSDSYDNNEPRKVWGWDYDYTTGWQTSWIKIEKGATTNVVKLKNNSYQFKVDKPDRWEWVAFQKNNSNINPEGLMAKWWCYDQRTFSNSHDCVFAFYPFGR